MQFEVFKELLTKFVSFKSVSTDVAYASEIDATVAWLKSLFEQNSFKVEILKGPDSNPVVFASLDIGKPETILVYGHYDVQPAELSDGWNSDPFVLTERSGRLYGRGTVDNKGQILAHVFTVLELNKLAKLKYNVKFLIEGNEETANPDLGNLIKENSSKMACDYVMISDGEIIGKNPVVEYSLRGGFNCKINFTTAKNNVHSGIYGGAIPSAPLELNKFLAKLFNADGSVNIPDFYAQVGEITEFELMNNKKLPDNDANVIEMTGVKTLLMEKGLDFYSQTGLRPTVQITGLKSGYISDGFSNIVPAQAEVRINFRTVLAQDNSAIKKNLEAFLKTNVPEYVDYSLVYSGPFDPVKVDLESPKLTEIRKLLKDAYGVDSLNKPSGGGVPVVSDFKSFLGKDSLLIGLGNEDCNMHGADENYDIDLLMKALRFSELFFTGKA